MKTLLSILLLVAAATQSLRSQTIQTITVPFLQNSLAYRQQDIPILAGETFEVLSFNDRAGLGISLLKTDGITIASNADGSSRTNIVVAGPRTVSAFVPENGSIALTYKITTVSQVATQNVASQAVVIPENASANADIIFESSTDLTNWTAAVAGSYAPSTSKRFFRVRLVTH